MFEEVIPTCKKPQKSPEVLSPEEVLHLLDHVRTLKQRTILTTCYAAGLRVSEVTRLPARTAREKSQMYAQRYVRHLPAAGEIVIFDRSWYNRAGVERVMGFCSEGEAKWFLELMPDVERTFVESGIILLNYWLEVSQEEQTLRLEARIHDGRKIWKLSPIDLKSYSRV